MRPTEILLDDGAGLPLVGTFGNPGLEMAAGLIVIACAIYGDKWQPVTYPMLTIAFHKNIRANRQPWAALNFNPARPQPDFFGLADRGFARFTESNRERSPIELTDAGLDRIREKWFRPGGAEKNPPRRIITS